VVTLYQWCFVAIGFVVYKLADSWAFKDWIGKVMFRVIAVTFLLALVVEGCEGGIVLVGYAVSFTVTDGDVIQRRLLLQRFDYAAD